MKVSELIGKEFKWVSTRTGGDTYGIIEKIIHISNYPKIESTNKNYYFLSECTVNLNGEFIKIDKVEN